MPGASKYTWSRAQPLHWLHFYTYRAIIHLSSIMDYSHSWTISIMWKGWYRLQYTGLVGQPCSGPLTIKHRPLGHIHITHTTHDDSKQNRILYPQGRLPWSYFWGNICSVEQPDSTQGDPHSINIATPGITNVNRCTRYHYSVSI